MQVHTICVHTCDTLELAETNCSLGINIILYLQCHYTTGETKA